MITMRVATSHNLVRRRCSRDAAEEKPGNQTESGDDAAAQRLRRSRTFTPANVADRRRVCGRRLRFPRAALRRVWLEHASRADAAACTPFPDGRNRLAARLAADVRRRGHRLGGRPGHGGRGSDVEGLRGALRHDAGRREDPGPVGRLSSDTTTDPVLAWLYVVDAWEGGLPSARYIGVMADAAEIAGAPSEYVHKIRTCP